MTANKFYARGVLTKAGGMNLPHDPHDEERIQYWMEAARRGDVIPPMLVDGTWNNGNVLDGVHRHEATDRTADQMARVENVIAIQGIDAARFFAALIIGRTRDENTHD